MFNSVKPRNKVYTAQVMLLMDRLAKISALNIFKSFNYETLLISSPSIIESNDDKHKNQRAITFLWRRYGVDTPRPCETHRDTH